MLANCAIHSAISCRRIQRVLDDSRGATLGITFTRKTKRVLARGKQAAVINLQRDCAMAALTDPTPAMVSFEQAIRDGHIKVRKAALDSAVVFYADQVPSGASRFAYARMNGPSVIAFANFVSNGHIDRIPVFQVGVAVPQAERGKGRAKHIMAVGIAELKHGLSRAHPGAEFFVEAVVGLDNLPSQNVAAGVLSARPKPITDEISGLRALHYIRKL